MVYTAEHLSLAILEVFVHLNVPIVEPDEVGEFLGDFVGLGEMGDVDGEVLK